MNIGLILAGGYGTRMGLDMPKQFIDINYKPVIALTIERFNNHSDIDGIVVVCVNEWQQYLRKCIKKFNLNKVKWIADSGSTRQESSRNGLEALRTILKSEDIVLIHDAARPLISDKIISDNIKGAEKYGAAVTVIPSTDTIIKSMDGEIITDVPVRSQLFQCQTPQSFKYGIISDGHKAAVLNRISDATDDSQIIFNTGKDVHLILGDKLNFKITTREDLILLKAIVKAAEGN